jgi:hypothetical protein
METTRTYHDGDLKLVEENSEKIYLFEGIDHTGDTKLFGIPKQQIAKIFERGSNISMAQFQMIVVPGIVLVEKIFQGLKRPLCDGNDMNADRLKMAFCWRPAFDYWWNEADRFESSRIEFREAPDGKVFVVNVTPNQDKVHYPSPDYWVERWYWVRRSPNDLKCPVDFESRYEKQLK